MIREVTCRSALTRSGIRSMDYSLNPYRGCTSGCIFCYAPSVLHEGREWGTFLDVKANIPARLVREMRRKRRGLVWISSVTDPYQPAEKRYGLTYRCLEVLGRCGWPVSVQTRSPLVVRDIDILSGMRSDVGFSASTLDESRRRVFEPGASRVHERFDAMRSLSERGVRTWLFLGPILPGITEHEVEDIVELAGDVGVSALQFDRLRFRPGVWERMEPHLPDDVRQEFSEARRSGAGYFAPIGERIRRACARRGIPIEPAF